MKIVRMIVCLMMMTNLAACSGSSEKDAPAETPTPEPTVEPTPEPTPEAIVYATDKVVNQFITDYNAISQSPFSDIEKGNIRTKFFAYSYTYYCELLHANDTDKMRVSISETNESADVGVAGMRNIFHDVVITIDPELSDDEVFAYFDELVKNEHMTDGAIGTMTINFVPDLELSGGHNRGHITIDAQ